MRVGLAGTALTLGVLLAACGAGPEADDTTEPAEATAEELRESDLDMPDIAIADAVPDDPAGRLAADDPSGMGGLAVDPLAGDYPEAPVPAGPTQPPAPVGLPRQDGASMQGE
ncbi:MAG: hypothetical protein NZM40_05560 [Sphingomonadaceae bacterium]|uniref:hypothetical protein n=1 Tax=Thermaurantiacus sp. TaxID=2820283 RepID=UPI00298F38D0|nr:hypothetical protein [Thermaurantiacus sp.]MCS6986884.1 hypothetical protein [Sphingomonadaceae bacterium]MDW8415516.1 hypothetical protein [Thermaurantiacus sp.]